MNEIYYFDFSVPTFKMLCNFIEYHSKYTLQSYSKSKV